VNGRRSQRQALLLLALCAAPACRPDTARAGANGDAGLRAAPSAAPAASAARAPQRRSFVVPRAAARPERPVAVRGGGARAVPGEHGVVSSVEAHATRIGVKILERGGNAVDAAVATAYALAVTHPSAGNIGGGGFMLIRPAGGSTVAVDFRETAPAALTRAEFDAMIAAGASGPRAVGVPGSVAGLNLAHARFGKLPLKELVAPAVELARRGHRLGNRQALTVKWSWNDLKRDAAARSIFGARGGKQPLAEGAVLRQPELARVLERIAQQADAGFYAGETARALVAAVKPQGGLMSLDDLAKYRAVVREPLRFEYRGLRIETMPPPSAGGVALCQMLLMLEELGAHRLEAGSADELHLFLEASRRAQAERRFGVGDPDALPPNLFAQKRVGWLDPQTLVARAPLVDPERTTPSPGVHPLFQVALRETEHTTHLSVVDAEGGVVSLTTTLSAGFGARIVAPDTGIVLNNSLAAFGTAGANQPSPGKRTTSSMAPTLVLEGERPVLVLGTPGGDTIPSTIVQVLRNVVDHGKTIDLAIDAPRLHHGFAPDEARYEKRRAPAKAVLDALRAKGHVFSKKLIPIGDANDVLIASGVAFAYADPREGGLALAARARAKAAPK
jgi:gamma-glutamyltranspeptidase / glutathione hydrolase